jgi:hypothetical protein
MWKAPKTPKTSKRNKDIKSNVIKDESGVTVENDHVNSFDGYMDDIIGPEDEIDSDDEEKNKKNRYDQQQEEDDGNKQPPYMFFDFRKGLDQWPSNVELIDPKRADELLEKATIQLEEQLKRKKKDDNDDNENIKGEGNGVTFSSSNGGWGSSSSSATTAAEDETGESTSQSLHPDILFETLKDNSTALIIKPGYRLKLKLNDLQDGGDENRVERERRALKSKKRAAKFAANSTSWGGGINTSSTGGTVGTAGTIDYWDFSSYDTKKWFKEYINEYTITIDMKLLEPPSRDGISLFQTALIHNNTESRSGKNTLSRSDGECIINQTGGIGIFGTYGDTTKARLEPNVWRRVVVSVKCIDKQNEKGVEKS